MGTRKSCSRKMVASGRAGANPPALNPLIGGDLFISVKAVEWVLENSKSSANPRNVLTVIAAHLNFDGYSWPSFDRLVELSNCSRPTVSKCLQELEDLGELKVNREDGKPNLYSLPKFKEVGPVNTSKEQLSRIEETSKPVFTGPVNPPLPEEVFKNNNKEKAEELSPSSVSKFEEQMQEKREHKEKREARKRGERFFQKPIRSSSPSRPITAKQPESWIWFSRLFKHLSDVNAVTMPELWPMVDEMVEEIGKEEAKDRLSIYLDGSAKVSGYLAKDFLCGGWKTIDPEEYHLPRIQNEEGT